jgi:MATE family multidrug resistance protein
MGLSTALDTLCSQAFTGSQNPHLVGIYFQRGTLLSILIFLPISLSWWYSNDLLLYLNIDAELSYLCSVYLKYLLIGALPYIIFENLKKFLQCQEIMNASTYILIIIVPINIALNYLLVNSPTFGLGFIGAPLAVSITNWLMLILGICYVAFIKGKSAWGGFSKQAFDEWGPFLKLGIPGILMVCSEWWAFEIISLMIAYFGNTQLAAHSIIMSVSSLFYMTPLGLSVSASTRMGNQLGRGKPNASKLTAFSALTLALTFATVNSATLTIFKPFWSYLFTNEDLVADLVAKLLPIVALFQVIS